MMREDVRSNRHDELAKFLVSRRLRLHPESCGLHAPRRRRRTPGLRRDEVSALAGISTAYYTWIEQGRKFDVSSGVLEAIAGALRLSDVESAHLFTLAGKAAPQQMISTKAPAHELPGALLQFADAFVDGPAMLLTPWLDVVEVNRSASELLGITPGANLAEAVLCGLTTRRIVNADALASAFVAVLRYNHALHVENERLSGVIDNLRRGNAAFRTRWDSHVIDRSSLLDFKIEHEGADYERFHGVVVSDPIAVRQLAMFMYRHTSNGESCDRRHRLHR